MRVTITSVTNWNIGDEELKELRDLILEACEDNGIRIDRRRITKGLLLREITSYMQGISPLNWEGMDGISMDAYDRTISFFEGEDTTDLISQIIDNI